jgi:hypothetical protein
VGGRLVSINLLCIFYGAIYALYPFSWIDDDRKSWRFLQNLHAFPGTIGFNAAQISGAAL